MVCPDCGSPTRTTKTLQSADHTSRGLVCTACNGMFKSVEKIASRFNPETRTLTPIKPKKSPGSRLLAATNSPSGSPEGEGGGLPSGQGSDPGPISVSPSDPSSKSGSGARAKSKPAAKDERARELVAVFCEEWRDRFRMGYVVMPRDANAAKTLSKASISPQDWRTASRRYLGATLWGNAQHSLWGLAMNVNGYMVTGDPKPVLRVVGRDERPENPYAKDFDAPLSEGPVRGR